MKLSIIVPVYNERDRLKAVLQFLFGSPCPIEREWIIVNDGSTDGSTELLRELSKFQEGFPPFVLLEQPVNCGKGAAIREGLKRVTGDYVLIQDADFEYDPSDIPSLLEPILGNSADVVYGSRFKKSGAQVHRTFHYFGNRFLTTLSNLLSGLYLTDMETCYKLFKSDLIRNMNLRSQRFGIEIELTAYIAKTSARVFELSIFYYPRNWTHGKKINWKDGVAAVFHLFRFNLFTSRDSAFSNLPETYSSRGFRLPPLLQGA